MEFYMKLPRSKKEFALFMGIVSIISVNIIAPLITFFEAGFHLYVYRDVLIVLPLIWLSVIVVVLLTYIPAEKMTAKIVSKGVDIYRGRYEKRRYLLSNLLWQAVLLQIS